MVRHWGKLGLCILLFIPFLAGCEFNQKGDIENVGLILADTIDDQVWGTMGYKGLLEIGAQLDVDVYYREKVSTEESVLATITEFQEKNVNFIIGHGSEFVPIFNKYSTEFPDIHFVSMNGDATNQNTTSLQFDGFAMGFFGGMIASKMSENEKVGIVAAYKWQGEVAGFIEGAKF